MISVNKLDERKKELESALKAMSRAARIHFDNAASDAKRVVVVSVLKKSLEELQAQLNNHSPLPKIGGKTTEKPKKKLSRLLPEDDCPEGFVKDRRGNCVPKPPLD